MLELDLKYEPEYRGEVKQHWNVMFAYQKKISVYGKRIMARVIDQIRDNDYQLRWSSENRQCEVLSSTAHA